MDNGSDKPQHVPETTADRLATWVLAMRDDKNVDPKTFCIIATLVQQTEILMRISDQLEFIHDRLEGIEGRR